MYVYVCCWFVKREIFVGYLLGMCLYYCVPYIRDGRCCVVEERFEGGEGLGFIHRDQRSGSRISVKGLTTGARGLMSRLGHRLSIALFQAGSRGEPYFLCASFGMLTRILEHHRTTVYTIHREASTASQISKESYQAFSLML